MKIKKVKKSKSESSNTFNSAQEKFIKQTLGKEVAKGVKGGIGGIIITIDN